MDEQNLPATTPELHEDIVFSLVIDGDLSKLSNEQIVGYYYHRCALLGLDPGEKPFDLIKLSGKLKLYTTKAGANALTRVNRLSVEVKSRGWDGPVYTVEARSSTTGGQFADDIGVIDLEEEHSRAARDNKTPITRANAMMKATTKAKRRAILALVGLGLLDESELDGVRGAERVSISQIQTRAPEQDPYMTGKLSSKAAAAMARCAKVAAKKSTADKLVTPRAVWEAACAKFKLPLMSDGSTPKIENLRKSVAWPICDHVAMWADQLDDEIIDAESTERQPGEDRDADHESDPSTGGAS